MRIDAGTTIPIGGVGIRCVDPTPGAPGIAAIPGACSGRVAAMGGREGGPTPGSVDTWVDAAMGDGVGSVGASPRIASGVDGSVSWSLVVIPAPRPRLPPFYRRSPRDTNASLEPPLDATRSVRIDPGIMTILGGFGGGGRAGGAGGPAAGAGKGGSVPYVTERDFEKEVLRSELPVLMEFTADWCQPCKTIAPEVEAFARDMEGKAKVVKIDVDKSPVIAQQLRVQSVPTFMVVAEGRIQDAVVGAIRKKKMQEMVEPFLPRAAGAIKPAELAQLLAGGAVSPIDTRDAGAFARAHLPGAVSMPLEGIEGRLAELHMLTGQPVLYCRSGDKTKEMAEKLAEQGVPVAFLEGGLLAWEAEGLPIER
jgi:thioredoxin 1/putative thioredoxin